MKNDCYLKLLSLLGVLLFLAACEKDSANDSIVRVTPTTPVNPANKAPVARAGEDAIIYVPLNTCTLNGSASADPDGDNLTYTWRIISGQSIFGKTEFSGSSNVGLYLNPGNYQFELTVSDVGKLSSKDTVNVTCIEPVCTGANKDVVIQNVA